MPYPGDNRKHFDCSASTDYARGQGSNRGGSGVASKGYTSGNGWANSNWNTNAAPAKRNFYEVDASGRRTGTKYVSSSAKKASLKAASRGRSSVYLNDPSMGRTYAYDLGTRPAPQTAHTRKYNIQNQPISQSRGWTNDAQW